MIYEATKQGRIEMFRESLHAAEARQDAGMIRAMRIELAALGVMETAQATATLEHATPAKPRRGRRPLPRCEHDMIVDRCPDCAGGGS